METGPLGRLETLSVDAESEHQCLSGLDDAARSICHGSLGGHPAMVSTRQKRVVFWFLVLLLVWAGYYALKLSLIGVPEDYPQIEEHFKYGSLGTDNLRRGLPYWIWKVLPEMFPQLLPQNGKSGYAAFGLTVEPGKDRPIGFSKRRIWGSD